MSSTSFSDTFRVYLQFVQAKNGSDFFESYEYSSMALSVVMDHISDHIDDPSIQALASALGEWEVDDGA